MKIKNRNKRERKPSPLFTTLILNNREILSRDYK